MTGLARTPARGHWRLARCAALVLLALGPARAAADPGLAGLGPDAWTARLAHPDPSARRGALWLLARHADLAAAGPRVVAQLASVVRRDTDPGALSAAVLALARSDSADARNALREGVQGRAASPLAGALCLRALALRGDAVPHLGQLLAATRQGAAHPLGDDVAALAERTLAELPEAAFSQAFTMALPAGVTSTGRAGMLRAIGRRGDPRWARALGDALRPGGRGAAAPVTRSALDAVSRLALGELAPATLALATSDDDPALRRAAVRALASLGGAFDAAALRPLLDDPALRGPALEALAALGDVGAAPSIAALLDAPWAGDRRAAAEALAALGARGVASRVAARAEREDDDDARRAEWRCVARMDDDDAAAALARVEHPAARWALAERYTLRPELRAAFEGRGDDASSVFLRAVSGARELGASLDDADADRRVAAALALGRASLPAGGRAEALARRLAREDDEGVRVALLASLGRVARDPTTDDGARRAALDALTHAASRALDASTPEAVAALSALGAAEWQGARAVMRASLAREEGAPWVRRLGAWGLGRLRDGGARVRLERALLTDPDVDVRVAAAHALARIGGASVDGLLADASMASWSGALVDGIARARLMARGGAAAEGRGVARASGAPPRSVWALARPDGGATVAVATGDGEAWFDGASEREAAEVARLR